MTKRAESLPSDPENFRPSVFLDRDGTLMEDVDYCRDPSRVRLLPGVRTGLRHLKRARFCNVIITNQSGIARGLITPAEFEAVQGQFLELAGDGLIDATYHCPDLPGPESKRRKPLPAMVNEAAADLHLDLSRSWMIGDKAIDVQCGRAAGVRPILVQTGSGLHEDGSEAEFVAKDFATAVEFILRNSGAR